MTDTTQHSRTFHNRSFLPARDQWRDRGTQSNWNQRGHQSNYRSWNNRNHWNNRNNTNNGDNRTRGLYRGHWRQRRQTIDTTNEQFGLMIRLIFEICQLRHHAVNWLQLPKSIGQNIDKIFDFIHLPRPNDILMGCMTSVKTLLKLELQEAGHTHIKTQLEKALNKLKLIDPTDKFKCITIVKHKLWNNLKSINRVDLDSWINECMDTVGTQFTQTKTQPETHNTYSDIVQRNSVRTNNVTVNAQQTHKSNA